MSEDMIKLLDSIIDNMDLIHTDEIPGIDLYMDQVTTFMDEHLKHSKRYDADKILTKTMINNYAKNELLPSPEKKKYTKEHVILLTFIYYFKNILSINDTKKLLAPITEQFFQSSKTPRLEDIYNEICSNEKDLVNGIHEDILKRINKSESSFAGFAEDERDFLKLFSLVCSLSFDVYVKKQMIESIIDTLQTPVSHEEREKEAKRIKEEREKEAKRIKEERERRDKAKAKSQASSKNK